jgi:hypothetical protein
MTLFIEGQYKTQAQANIANLERAILKTGGEEGQVIAPAVVGVVASLFMAFDGIGTALERLANSVEKLEGYAAVDLNATIEQAIADRTDNIEQSAVEKFKEDTTRRDFIGKPT